MRKRMYIEVIEPKTITLTKDQKQWVLTFVERDLSNDNRQERTFWIDAKINPPRDKFILIRYVGGGFKRGHFSRWAGPIGATQDQVIRSINSAS